VLMTEWHMSKSHILMEGHATKFSDLSKSGCIINCRQLSDFFRWWWRRIPSRLKLLLLVVHPEEISSKRRCWQRKHDCICHNAVENVRLAHSCVVVVDVRMKRH